MFLGGWLSRRVFRRCTGLLLLRQAPVLERRERAQVRVRVRVPVRSEPVLQGRGRRLGPVRGQRVPGRPRVPAPVQ